MMKRKKFTQQKKFVTPRADRPKEERAKECERMGGGLGGLSGADHQMPAGVGSGGEAAVAALLEPVAPIPA